jgi:DNA uptake protein ComE-like DNA-binding protein
MSSDPLTSSDRVMRCVVLPRRRVSTRVAVRRARSLGTRLPVPNRERGLFIAILAPLAAAAQSESPAPAKATPASGQGARAQTSKQVATGPTKTASSSKHDPGAKHVSMRRVDLNTAKAAELEKLPGVNDALANAIIAARPIKSGADLVSRKVLAQAEWNKLQQRVTFGAAMSKSEPFDSGALRFSCVRPQGNGGGTLLVQAACARADFLRITTWPAW